MLKEALRLHESGEVVPSSPILIIGANKNHTDMLREMFRKIGGYRIIPRENRCIFFRSVEQCNRFFQYGMIFREIFVDHFVYEMGKM